MLHSVKDTTGLIDLYISAVDDMGNYGVSAPTATGFVWLTPLSTWQITNSTTTHTSTTSYSLTSNSVTITGESTISLSGASITVSGSTSVSVTAPTISATGTVTLGATGGAPLLKAGSEFLTAWSAYFTGAAAAWGALNALMPNPAFTTAQTAATALAALASPTTLVTAM
jgi:hypothetical protein